MKGQIRVMIDARMLIGRFSGVGRFVTSLIRGLQASGRVDVVALCGDANDQQTPFDPGVELIRSSFRRRDRSAMRRLVWEEHHLPSLIDNAGVDLYHATWNSGVPAFSPVPVVLTIHDLIPWLNPKEHFARMWDRLAYRTAMRWSAARATAITAVSKFSRRQVMDHLGAEPARVTTIYNGAVLPAPGLPRPRSRQAGAPYLLYVGGHQHRKNVAGLLRTIARAWAHGHEHLELHLTGQPEMLEPEAARMYRSLQDRSRIRFLGHPDDQALAREYAHARAMVFLSRDEGFGLPVIEAMGHGCPVIASDRAALPEVAGDAAEIVNPDDPKAVSRAIDRVCCDSPQRARLVEKGLLRAKQFTWRRTTIGMMQVYEGICGQDRGLSEPETSRIRHGSLAGLVAETVPGADVRESAPPESPCHTR